MSQKQLFSTETDSTTNFVDILGKGIAYLQMTFLDTSTVKINYNIYDWVWPLLEYRFQWRGKVIAIVQF